MDTRWTGRGGQSHGHRAVERSFAQRARCAAPIFFRADADMGSHQVIQQGAELLGITGDSELFRQRGF
jgi:hypothetical protein